jgi:hypothetical protein
MNNDLEKYILKNRQDLDHETPPDFILSAINEELFKTKKRPVWLWKAATVLLLITTSVLLYVQLSQNLVTSKIPQLGHLSPEYQSIENDYQNTINAIQVKLNLNEIDKEEFGWLLDELNYLEKINLDFRKDLSSQANQEKLVATLIDYYEKKLKILKRLELEINRRKNERDVNITI